MANQIFHVVETGFPRGIEIGKEKGQGTLDLHLEAATLRALTWWVGDMCLSFEQVDMEAGDSLDLHRQCSEGVDLEEEECRAEVEVVTEEAIDEGMKTEAGAEIEQLELVAQHVIETGIGTEIGIEALVPVDPLRPPEAESGVAGPPHRTCGTVLVQVQEAEGAERRLLSQGDDPAPRHHHHHPRGPDLHHLRPAARAPGRPRDAATRATLRARARGPPLPLGLRARPPDHDHGLLPSPDPGLGLPPDPGLCPLLPPGPPPPVLGLGQDQARYNTHHHHHPDPQTYKHANKIKQLLSSLKSINCLKKKFSLNVTAIHACHSFHCVCFT